MSKQIDQKNCGGLREFQIYGVMWFVGLTCMLVYSSAQLTSSEFYFTLDDPYIHLSVAEQILRGEYGVNRGEFASPSSSILYPFLLAIPLLLGLGQLAPLAITIPAQIAVVWIFSGLVWRFGVVPDRPDSRIVAIIVLPFLLAATNTFALPLTGMEHSLHVLATVLVAAGLVDLERGRPTPIVLVAGIVLAPLMRFEGIVLCGAALVVLLWYGKKRSALASGAAISMCFLVYWTLMSRLGLPFLPSSVLAKSGAAASLMDGTFANEFMRLVTNFAQNVAGRGQALAFMVFLMVMAAAVRCPDPEKRIVIALVPSVATIAHLFAGRLGEWPRYEAYLVTLSIVSLAYLWWPIIVKGNGRRLVSSMGILIGSLALSMGYIADTLRVPRASENVFLQQFQMHRFATEYFVHPVAVNDLGWVSFENEGYVLDLWGLGSEEARKLRASSGYSSTDVAALSQEHSVVYAMIYDDWLGSVMPDNWCRIAVLRSPRVTAASGEVAFYLAHQGFEAEMRSALFAFQAAIPQAAGLRINRCPVGSG